MAQLAKDLSSPSNADREVAVSMLANLTIYLEHHDALHAAGVFPALLRAVLNVKIVPQVMKPNRTMLTLINAPVFSLALASPRCYRNRHKSSAVP